MKIGVPKEIKNGESRVAATPASVKQLTKKGASFVIESGAGVQAGFSDEDYKAEGAEIADAASALSAEAVFKVAPPTAEEISKMSKGALLVSLLAPLDQDTCLPALAAAEINAVALEIVPRTSRAQSMDVLSSQANIAGYRAVLEAAANYPRFFPMMMTSAGMAKPAKAAVLGVGVAGLQAIATLKRLGCKVEAFDVRPEVKEQIESLGAKFMDLGIEEEGSGEGGYAKELSEEGKKKQQQALNERLKDMDVVITTAAIPGRQAPELVTADALQGMRPGSIVVDMAAATGGNCRDTEAGKTVVKQGVTLIGELNYPALMPGDASLFYGKNIANLLELFIETKDGGASIIYNMEDDIVAGCLAVKDGTQLFPKKKEG
jgi:NAD(P) transhydrogenase subunit alpha